MKRRILMFVTAALLAGTGWFGYAAWRASHNLVTLDVRDTPLRVVLRMIERQTWETLLAHKDVDGRVTLKVKNAPLEDVLSILSDQTSSRWTSVFPLYQKSRSLVSLKKALEGEVAASGLSWTNLQTRPFGFRGGMFGDNLRNDNKLVSVNIEGKDLGVATLALARFGRAQIVPEDGTEGTIQLTLQQATMDEAVTKLARQVKRNWTEYYAFQPGFGRGPRPMAGLNGDTSGPPTNAMPWDGPSPEMRAQLEKQFEAQLETMPPEERQKLTEERQRREQVRAEMQNMTPEQRQQRIAQMASDPQRQGRMQSQMQSRMMSGIKNTTPAQRVERYQRMNEMRKRFEGGGPPGRP